MPVLGLRGTGSFSADDRPKNYRGVLLLLKPTTRAPLTAMTGQLRNEPTDDAEFKVATKGLPNERTTVSDTVNTATTTVTVAAGQGNLFRPGYAVMNERTGEVFWVTSNTSTVLTVARGKGSTAAQMLPGDGILILSSSHQEGAAIPTAISDDPVYVTNYTQIFRTPLNLTGTGAATRLRYADNPKVELKREALERHAIEMEKQFLFGSGVEDTSGAQPQRTTKGLFFFTTTNVKDMADAVDMSSWVNFLEDCFEDGSDEKLFLCGNRALTTANELARLTGHINITSRDETYGMQMLTWVTPYGTLQIKQHPLLSKNPTFQDWGFVVDPAHIVYRYLRGRDTKYLENRQAPGDDTVTDEFLSEAGMECQFEQVHGVVKNMSVAVP